jgi:uncharacterized membrane protein
MPIGGYLDTLPAFLFVAVHLVLLVVGVWAIWRANADGMTYAWAFGLYAVSQIVFLGFFGGVITIKLAVLLEQILIVILVIWIAMSPSMMRRSAPPAR